MTYEEKAVKQSDAVPPYAAGGVGIGLIGLIYALLAIAQAIRETQRA